MLGLEENTTNVLFFGQIRPYKNVPELVKVFSRLQQRDVRLLIVGNLANNRLMAQALSGQEFPVELHEVPDMHNYTGWRDALHPHLTRLLAEVWG